MKTKRIHYAWIVFLACFLLAFTIIGLCNNTKPLYLDPVASGLGVTRAQLSSVYMISGLLAAGCSLFIGPIRKRLSLHQLAIIGTTSLLIANLIYAFSTSLWTYMIGEALFGLGTGFASMTVIALIIRAWFAGRHGTILGCLYMATGLGSVFLAPEVGKLIANYGYQTSYLVSAAVMVIALLTAVLLVRNDPEEKGLRPMFEGEKAAAAGGEKEGLSLGQALRTPRFYIMCLLGLMLGGGVNAVQGTYAAYIGKDLGMGTVFASSIVSFLYLINSVGKVPLGILIDKIGVRRVVNICSVGMAGAALCLILLSKGQPTAYVFGVCMGIGNILFTVPAPLVAPAIFGTKDVTAMTGIFMACMSFGSAACSPLSNLVYDLTGSYIPLYQAMVVMFLVAMVLNTVFVRPAWKNGK